MNRSADDDNSVVTTMTNGFGSPPKIDQPSASQQQQREEQQLQQCQRNASDYLSLSGTKARSNSNNVCGAPSFVAHMSEEIASVSQGSQCRVANDIIVPKTASVFDLTHQRKLNPKVGEQTHLGQSLNDQKADGRLNLGNEVARNEGAKMVEKSVTSKSITSNSVDKMNETCSGYLDGDQKEVENNHTNNPHEEPDEIPCLMPFIPVDAIEEMLDPLMDTGEASDAILEMCHNGDGRSESNVDGEDENDDTSSVEFVSQESAVANTTFCAAMGSEENAATDKRRRLAHFRCSECHLSFVTESELELHKETSDVASLCEQCDSSFWSPCALNRHKSEHAAAMKQIAYASGYRADSAAASFQQRCSGLFGADKPYACEHCGAGYTTKFNLMRHVRKNVVWAKNGQPFECDLCDATFLARCLLPIHKQEKHAEFVELDPQIMGDSMNYVEATLDSDDKSVIVTPQFDLLQGECDPLEEESHPAATNSSYHTFRTATATGISYNCKWCPEKVASHPALIAHIRETHPDVELYRCEPCNKTFLNKAGLYGHLTHHRFQCDKCDLNFSTEEFLRQHQVVHGDDAAASSTPSSTLLSQHSSASKPQAAKSIVPRSKPTKTAKCDGLPYFELLARVPHMKKPFECEFCGKKLAYKTTFLEHYLTHTGERPFRCSVCGQGFIRERAMEIHESSHGVLLNQTATPPVSEPRSILSALSPIVPPKKNFTEINGRRQTARKSTNAVARPSNRINPVGRAVINSALFDPQLDVTPEDVDAFYFLPVVCLKMADVSALEEHAYVCPYCDKFFPRPTSLCGHKKICSYLTRMRAQKESAAAMGVSLPVVPRKWTPRITGVSSVATNSSMSTSASGRSNFYSRPEDSTVVIANMRHHIVFERGERIFVCGVCGKQFSRKFTLSEHCRSHTTDRPFHCDWCPRAFKRKSSLFRHRRRNHAKMGAVSGHQQHHHQQPSFAQHPIADQNWMSFEPQCNVEIEFSDEDEDYDDEDDDTPGEEDDFKPFVEFDGNEYSAQQANVLYDYCSEMSVFEPQCIVKDQVSSDEENSGSHCDYYAPPADDCQLIDASMNHFLEVGLANNGPTWRDAATHDDEDASRRRLPAAAVAEQRARPELEYEQLEQQQRQQLAAINRFLCGECNRRFPRREDLRRHFAEHDSVGPFKCFYCDKTFDRRKYLSKHARNHDKKKSYQCSYCERAYVTNAELTIHVRIHTGERPFECDQCGKGFRVQKQLTLHYRTHTGEKPYACAHCPSTFSRHETLFRHNRVCQARNNVAAAATVVTTASAVPSLATPQLSQLLQRPLAQPLPPSPAPHQSQPSPHAPLSDAAASPDRGYP